VNIPLKKKGELNSQWGTKITSTKEKKYVNRPGQGDRAEGVLPERRAKTGKKERSLPYFALKKKDRGLGEGFLLVKDGYLGVKRGRGLGRCRIETV